MESLSSAISVQVDLNDKELANGILKNLGLNMSTFVNMAIKQLIYNNGLPFEVKNPKPNKELFESLKQSEQLIKEIKEAKRKGYSSMEDLINALDED